ncbi:MAG: SGNH/GDSL hydrolase family protein [Clostridia bacterium]|nr:SGNH/GDSL hydrolase family protein [Clostridia bacterium]
MSKCILFQGDSITDCGRDKINSTSEGRGYPLLVKAELGESNPLDYTFLNRGISGNRIVDVYARIKSDIINLKPDYMSLLIGVNDVWHEINSQNGVDTDKFEKIYSMLIEEVKAALPDIKIFLLAPYVIEGSSTENCEEKPNRWELFREGVDEKIESVKRVGQKFNLPVVELQPIFDEACKRAPNTHWSADGVHPTATGHTLIKRAWLSAFNTIK